MTSRILNLNCVFFYINVCFEGVFDFGKVCFFQWFAWQRIASGGENDPFYVVLGDKAVAIQVGDFNAYAGANSTFLFFAG